jgi:hypothetical protein
MRRHITIALFEAFETSRKTLARSLQDLSKNYGLTKKILAYVKNESANMNTMTIVLKSIVSCEALDVMESFYGICFWHTFSKACQYATIEKRILRGLEYFSIKSA